MSIAKLSKQQYFFRVLGYGVNAIAPTMIVIVATVTLFWNAVVASIVSTPHPEVVYLIFGGFFMGLILSWYSLLRFIREESYLRRWQKTGKEDRASLLESTQWVPQLSPLYNLLSGKAVLPLRMRQAAVENEMLEFEKSIGSQLTLPGFLGGALIGLGLVGTFIGLLGTLDELGNLFSALMGNSSAGATQADMFKDMLQKLQAPMRGMGTAFVASLYGLMGSLLLGMVVMSVRKTGGQVVKAIRESVRDYDYGAGSEGVLALQADTELAWAESERWNAMFQQMRERNETLTALMLQMQDETRGVLRSAEDLNRTMRERNELDGVIARVIADGTQMVAKATDHYQSLLESATQTRQDIQSMVAATVNINQTLQERNRIDAMVHQVMAAGPHWMDAWDQMGTQLRQIHHQDQTQHQQHRALQSETNLHLKLMAEALVRAQASQTLLGNQLLQSQSLQQTEQQALRESLLACKDTFEEMGAKLRIQLGLQAHAAPAQAQAQASPGVPGTD
jgi:hypothetical protein